MQYDFLLVGSWSPGSQRQMVAWLRDLERRGRDAFLLVPSRTSEFAIPADVDHLVLDEHEDERPETSPTEVEQRYGVPSLVHLTFSERLLFNLTRTEALARGVRVAETISRLFESHQYDRVLQVRGPEIHKLLVHHAMKASGNIPLWAGFSPFEDSFSLQTVLDGTWDAYRTIPYDDIPEDEREAVADHIDEFREAKKVFTYGMDEGPTAGIRGISRFVRSTIGDARTRNRPGALHDAGAEMAKLRLYETVNRRLLPTVSESRRRCDRSDYVLFPLQYPKESRLTVFSPQFYRQESLLEYLARVLPSSVELFVKPHPNRPGYPSPFMLRRLAENDNIRFLNPRFNAHVAIESAACVVVINNTVGFETLYHQTPLFTLGTAFYGDTPASISIDTLEALPEVLAEHLSTPVTSQSAVSSIYSLMEATSEGDITSNEEPNVRTVVESVLQFVDEVEGG